MSATLRALAEGEIFAKFYKVDRELKTGGMGAVYIVKHTETEKRHALKVMRPEIVADADARERFKREAKVAGIIDDPRIVDVVHAGVDEATGMPFLVMELLQGRDLGEQIKLHGRMTPEELLPLLRQAARALDKAHAKRIVHRDLKPDNLFLVLREGEPPSIKILDFGIAKFISGVTTQSTMAGGTPLYMAPEQTKRSSNVGAQTDVWALGLIAYAALVGRAYWEAQDIHSLYGEILGGDFESASVRAARCGVPLPVGFDTFFFRCVAVDPSKRFSTAGEAIAALEQVFAAAGHTALMTPAPPLARTELMPRPPAAALQTPVAGQTTTTPTAEPVVETTSKKPLPLVPIGIGAAVVVVAIGAVALSKTGKTEGAPATTVPSNSAPSVEKSVAKPAKELPPLNRWIKVDPAPAGTILGVAKDNPGDEVSGFWPARKITAPTAAYEMHQHEVTWEELDTWLTTHPEVKITRPTWATNKRPVAGVAWKVAYDYCASVGGALPTEEEWEWAARGVERRPQPWGTSPVDPDRTFFFQGSNATPVDVMTRDQDRTPSGIADLLGNVQEWTADLYRDDDPPKDGVESRSRVGSTIFRAIRGLPLRQSLPAKLQTELTAYRDALCASGNCAVEAVEIQKQVGFRCVKR